MHCKCTLNYSLHYRLLFVNHKLLFVHTTGDCTGQNHGQYSNCHHLEKITLIISKNYQQIIIYTYSWQNSSGKVASDQRKAHRDCSKNRDPSCWNKQLMLQQLHYVWTPHTPKSMMELGVVKYRTKHKWLTSMLEPLFGGKVGSPSSSVQSGLYKSRENSLGTNNDPTTIPAPKLMVETQGIHSMLTLTLIRSLSSISVKSDPWPVCKLNLS